MRILVIDDEPGVRRALAKWLTGHGHQVDEAADGQEGLDKMRSTPYGLVVLDVMLPVVGGIEIAREKLRDPLIAKTPLVLMSGLDPSVVEELCADSGVALVGATVLLTKPFAMSALDGIVAAVEHLGS